MHTKHKSHTFRNVFLSLVALIILGTAAFGMSHYRSVKAAINSSFAPSGVDKERNVSSILKKRTPVSILLMGTDNDESGRNYTGRTDSMMVVTIDSKTKKTSITSIPSDSAVVVPGFKGKSPAKISAAYSYGQAKTAVTTVGKFLNVPIDFYALINMNAMEQVIDKINGVDIFEQGQKTHMNSTKAINYVNDANDDYGRQVRQFEILRGILRKSDSISTLLNQDFFNTLAKQTQTDLTFADLRVLAKSYFAGDGEIDQTHLKGESNRIAKQSMKVIKQSELQRVTNFVRGNLNLEHVKTGTIAYKLDEKIQPDVKKKTKKKKSTKKSKKVATQTETTNNNASDNSSSVGNATSTADNSATTGSSTTGTGSTNSSNGTASSYTGGSSRGTSSNSSSYTGSTGGSGSSSNSYYGGGTTSSNTSGSTSSTTGSNSSNNTTSSNDSSNSYGSGSSTSDGSDSGVTNGYESSGYGE